CPHCHLELQVPRRSYAPFESANKAKTLEVALNASLVLLNTGEDHDCFFLREEVNNRTGVRCTKYWVCGWSWGQRGSRKDCSSRHPYLRSGSSFLWGGR